MTDRNRHNIKAWLDAHGMTHMTPGAWLMDMDGTLYDSMPNHANAWWRMVQEYGIDAIPEEFYMFEGATGRFTIDRLMQRCFGRKASDKEVEEMYHRKTELFKELPEPEIMPGAKELVDTVRSLPEHPTIILVTGSGQGSLLDRLNNDYNGAFPDDKRITARNVTKGKPDPEPYVKAAELAGVPASRCIAVENAPLGVESAHRAGVFTIAVTTGPIPAQAMWDAGADVVFDSMPQCASQIKELLHLLNNETV